MIGQSLVIGDTGVASSLYAKSEGANMVVSISETTHARYNLAFSKKDNDGNHGVSEKGI